MVYIVHLEALKADLQGLPRRSQRTWIQALISFLTTIIGMTILSAVVYYGLGWIKTAAGAATPFVATALLIVAYLGLLKYAATVRPLDASHAIDELPESGPTVKAGLYFLLPPFRPGYIWDQIYPPLESIPGSQIVEMAEKAAADELLRISVAGETLEGDQVEKTVMLSMGSAGPGAQRPEEAGLTVREEEGKVLVD